MWKRGFVEECLCEGLFQFWRGYSGWCCGVDDVMPRVLSRSTVQMVLCALRLMTLTFGFDIASVPLA